LDYIRLLFQYGIIFLIILLILSIFSCNKYYFILDAIIISILGISFYLSLYINGYAYNFIEFYIYARGIIVFILFIKNIIRKEIIKIYKWNLEHKIFMIINIIINIFFIISYIYYIFYITYA
jgi:hypothetical protein